MSDRFGYEPMASNGSVMRYCVFERTNPEHVNRVLAEGVALEPARRIVEALNAQMDTIGRYLSDPSIPVPHHPQER